MRPELCAEALRLGRVLCGLAPDEAEVHGLTALERASALGGEPGPYGLQAAMAACHAVAFRPEDTDWRQVVWLYERLADVNPSPIVELNRAVAVSMAFGPEAGLDLVDQLSASGTIDSYHLLHGVRGGLLAKLDRHDEASASFLQAASLTQNESEHQLLLSRAETDGNRTTASP